jgi:hypothetical protein
MTPSSGQAHGLFASLASNLQDSFACLPRAPFWLAAMGVAIGLIGIRFSARAATVQEYRQREEDWRRRHETLLRQPNLSDSSEPLTRDDLREAIAADLMSGSARGAQLALSIIAAFWAIAIGSGVALFVVYLVHAGYATSVFFWLAVGALGWLARRVESFMTDRRWRAMKPRPEPPNTKEAEDRLLAYHVKYFAKTGRLQDRSAMPLLYAYSRLSLEELRSEFAQRGISGVASTIGLFYLTSWVIILYPLFPIPSPAFNRAASFAQCTFVNAHEFFGVARANEWPYLVLGSFLLLLTPFVVQGHYLAFMNEWSFPASIKRAALQREAGFAARMTFYRTPVAIVQAILVCLILWLSASVAARSGSAYWGIAILLAPILILNVLSGRWIRGSRATRR